MIEDPFKNMYMVPPGALQAIVQKTQELYEKRIAPYAKDLSDVHKKAIINFQQLVFTIDYYGEHTEKIDPVVLDSFWKQSENFLSDLGIEAPLRATLLQDIKDYADIEQSTRTGKKLSDYDIKLFYFKKSCDVRMQRHLLRFLNKSKPESSEEEVTRDMLEEIEDDMDDIEEDKLTPLNGNRLLEILNSKNIQKLDEYSTFVNSLQNVPEALVQKIKAQVNNLKSELAE